MRLSTALIALGLVAVVGTPARAATVLSDHGHVLVNQGDGYRLVTQPTAVAPGHLVIVNPGGAGRVAYPDGCTVDIRPGAVYSVAQRSPCQATAGAGHVETGGTIKEPPPAPPPEGQSSLSAPLILGGAAVAAGVGLLLSQGGGGDKSASP
jgi:hypothetical protein